MSNEEQKPWLDLGPTYPKRPTTVIPPMREDGAAEAGPAGLEQGDMSTGSSKGASNSKMKTTPPPITRNEDGSANRET
jgi:hypothetical protein